MSLRQLLFEDSPRGRRALGLLIYALVGPLFTLILWLQVGVSEPLLAVMALVGAGGAWLVLRPAPGVVDWIFPVAVAPTLCFAVGFAACGSAGLAYLGLLGTPLAAAAVIFGPAVVVSAWATATAACLGLLLRGGSDLGPAVANTFVYGATLALVAWVIHGKAASLREARRDLRRSREQLALALDGSDLSAWEWDLRTGGLSYGPAWPALLGYPPGEIAPFHPSWAALVHPQDAPRVNSHVVAHLKGDLRGLDVEYRMRARDGSWRWIHSRGKVVEVEGGRAVRVTGTHADETRRREAEDGLREALAANERLVSELREQEGRLRLALDSGDHAEWDLDLVGNRFRHGARWWDILGRAPGSAAMTVEGWAALVHPDDLEQVRAGFQGCLEGHASKYQCRYRIQHAAGGWRWVRTRGTVVERDAGGRALRFSGTHTDCTEVVELQEKLLAATRLASVGTLAAGVAHEINNPLVWVTANLSHALEGFPSPGASAGAAADPLRELLEEALQGAHRIAEVVRAMRSLGRAEACEAPRPVDVGAELGEALKMVRNQLVQRARLEVDLPPGLPRARARTNELGRVFLNLLVNAVQAIPEGNAAAHRIAVCARAEGERVVIEVSDSGPGIPPEIRDRIFEPFFTTKPVGVGTGLGLSIARSIVEGAGGQLGVVSRTGGGTTFRVSLPAEVEALAAEATEKSGPGAVRPGESPRRVLVIDDEPLVRRSLVRMLSKVHQVSAVASAAEALERIDQGERWDAIFCDLMMPEMDGIGFYEALVARGNPGVSQLAFITGGAFGERASRFLAEHEVMTIPKPPQPADLLAATERLRPQDARALRE